MRELLAAAVFAITLVGCSPEPVDFEDSHGQGYFREDFQGRWLMVNYFATWCAPCIREIPELNALNREHDDIRVMGVDFDGAEGNALKTTIEKMKIEFPVFIRDPSPLLGYVRPEVLPTTFIFSPSGELIETLVGPQTESTLMAVLGPSD